MTRIFRGAFCLLAVIACQAQVEVLQVGKDGFLSYDQGETGRSVYAGDFLEKGARVQTSGRGFVDFRFANGSLARVGGFSAAILGQDGVEVQEGLVFGSASRSFEIKTAKQSRRVTGDFDLSAEDILQTNSVREIVELREAWARTEGFVVAPRNGRVMVAPGSNLQWKDVSAIRRLNSGVWIRTLAGGAADLGFRNGMHARLPEKSLVRVERADRKSGDYEVSIVIEEGRMVVAEQDLMQESRFEVRTKAGLVKGRGFQTVFDVNADGDVRCQQGPITAAIIVNGIPEISTVRSGEKMIVKEFSREKPVQPFEAVERSMIEQEIRDLRNGPVARE